MIAADPLSVIEFFTAVVDIIAGFADFLFNLLLLFNFIF